MKALLKFSLCFSLSFVLLSVPIAGRPVFNHLHDKALPVARKLFQSFKVGADRASDWAPKLFTNSTPEGERASSAPTSSKVEKEIKTDAARESYTPEERALVEKILESQ